MLSSTADIRCLTAAEIQSVYFCLSSEADIRNRSVLQISTSDLYIKDGSSGRSIAAPGGILDARLGMCGGSFKRGGCITCGLKFSECPGHWGHIELVEPMYNTIYMDQLMKVLNSVCFFCGTLYADVHKLEELAHDRRLLYANKVGKDTKTACVQCGKLRVNILNSRTTNKGLLSAVYSGKDERPELVPESGMLYARDALRVLRLINDNSCSLLGLSQRPEAMLFTVFPVPPLNIRPTSVSGQERRESELTVKLRRIVSANMKLSKIRDRSLFIYQKHLLLLQSSISDYISGESCNGRRTMPLSDRKQAGERMTLQERLNKKQGRVRANLMGKRVNFSARTVIGPDPALKIDEVGVPQHVCMSLTYPQRVTLFNMQQLYSFVRNGPDNYPGANYIVRQDGSRMDLRVCSSGSVRLDIGDTVERHLVDGDIVVMNRQPSLHRMSMMGHRVRVRPSVLNFSLNLAVCPPYNADFDGDEMNLHVPQSEEARAEIAEINMVSNHIINPKTCGPVIKLIQDAMHGTSLMTRADTLISARQLSNIVMRLDAVTLPNLREKDSWTGKELFSLAIPSGIYLRKGEVVIKDGQLLSGMLTSAEVNGRTGLIRTIHKELGAAAATDFLNKAQIIANAWLEEEGVSIGISDMMLDAETAKLIEQLKQRDDRGFQHEMRQQALTNDDILNKQNAIRDHYVNIVKAAFKRTGNSIADTIQTGSKGDYIKLSQMTAVVGTQAIRGKPLQKSNDTGKTMIYFSEDSSRLVSRGFIASSYIEGLKPSEYVIHAAAGREGLTDTAVKTSETGYIQRRLIKACEDITVRFDGSVRRSNGCIIQPSYAFHGMDPVQLEVQVIRLHTWTEEQLRETHLWSDAGGCSEALRKEHHNILKLWNYAVKHKRKLSHWEHEIAAAFHMERLLWEAAARHPHGHVVDRECVAERLIELASQLTQQAQPLHMVGSVLLHHWLLLEYAASKVIVKKYAMSVAAFDWLMKRLLHHFNNSSIHPGEAVGMIAAQALGSDTTQMTLNTFHFCGQSSMDITLGVPRLKEIVDVKETKQPRLTLQLEGEDNEDRLGTLVSLTINACLVDILLQIELLQLSTVEEEERCIQDNYLLTETEEFKNRLSDAVLRLQFDSQIVGRAVQMSLIVRRLQSLLSPDDNYIIMGSDDNDDARSIVHIRYLQPVTAKGAVKCEKQTALRMRRAYEIFSNPKTMLLPVASTTQPQIMNGNEIVLNSRAMNSDLLLLKAVLPEKTYCNDFKQVASVLGIEAAREVLRREAIKVFKFGGTAVLPAHIDLLVDVMTYTGCLTGVTRFGVVKYQSPGPLMQCSFETTTNVLRDAAVLGKTDNILGVSECIMMGRPPRIGTHMDTDIIEQAVMADFASPCYTDLLENHQPRSPVYSLNHQSPSDSDDGDVTFESVFRSVSSCASLPPNTSFSGEYGSMIHCSVSSCVG